MSRRSPTNGGKGPATFRTFFNDPPPKSDSARRLNLHPVWFLPSPLLQHRVTQLPHLHCAEIQQNTVTWSLAGGAEVEAGSSLWLIYRKSSLHWVCPRSSDWRPSLLGSCFHFTFARHLGHSEFVLSTLRPGGRRPKQPPPARCRLAPPERDPPAAAARCCACAVGFPPPAAPLCPRPPGGHTPRIDGGWWWNCACGKKFHKALG